MGSSRKVKVATQSYGAKSRWDEGAWVRVTKGVHIHKSFTVTSVFWDPDVHRFVYLGWWCGKLLDAKEDELEPY